MRSVKSGQMDLANFQLTQIYSETKSLGIKPDGQPMVTFCRLQCLLLPIMEL